MKLETTSESTRFEKSENVTRGKTLEFPVITLEEAIRVAKIVMDNGGSVRHKDIISTALHVKGGALQSRITGTKRYGLVEGEGKELKITELAKQILRPLTEIQKKPKT